MEKDIKIDLWAAGCECVNWTDAAMIGLWRVFMMIMVNSKFH